MKQCQGVGGLAVMEVPHMVGARTRARTLALAAAAAAGASSKRRKTVDSREVQSSHLQLRSRGVAVTRPGISKPTVNSAVVRCPSPEWDRISRCSSNAGFKDDRCFRPRDPECSEGLEAMGCCVECSRAREATPSSGDESEVVESALAAEGMPSEAEMEEFFSAAERVEKQRFAQKYNYDVVGDVPLDGRYQWVPLKP